MSWRQELVKSSQESREKLAELLDRQCFNLFGNHRASDRIEFITKDATLVGFAPQISNMKMTNPRIIHDHVLDSPALVFASKDCPCSIIVGPRLDKQMKKSEKMDRDEYQHICDDTFHVGVSQGVVLALNWFLDLSEAKKKHLEIAKENALKALLMFKEGKKSPIATKFVDTLAKDFNLIGFSPNIIYVKCVSDFADELGVEWCHPFSQPTLTYQHKTLPILIQVNGNIAYNETRLARNPENIKDKEMAMELTNLRGFTG